MTSQQIISYCFIVRDGESYLSQNLDRIIYMSSKFKDFHIFFIENDSVDNTRNILEKYKDTYPLHIHGKCISAARLHTAEMCTNDLNPNCKQRTTFLAKIRQKVLDHALEIESDLIVVLDMDFISFNDNDFTNMLTRFNTLDSDGIFGMSYTPGGAPYDIGAVYPYYKVFMIKYKNSQLISVKSAFSGFGVYRTSAIRHKLPQYDGSSGIEHNHFNYQLSNLYVFPSFQPIYNGTSKYYYLYLTMIISILISMIVSILLLPLLIYIRHIRNNK
jgi:glycosyltransferase involved in cell wall biosynthesis